MSQVSAILGSWVSYSKLTSSHDDDWVDRLNHLYTVILLAIFAVFTSTGQYAGNPIECWCPAHFTSAFVAYTKSYCWVKNTYHIQMDWPIPVEQEQRNSEELSYYQWVPIILMFMAFLFKFPALVWNVLNGSSGMNVAKIVSMSEDIMIGPLEKRDETLRNIACYMNRWLQGHKHYHWNVIVRMRQKASRFFCFCCAKRDGTYITGLYIFIKMLFVANAITQFFLLNAFMGGWFSMYGVEVVDGLVRDHNWRDSPRFPKVTLCDFDIRQLQNIQTYTVQCVLPINLYNEKIFIFLWFWFVLVAFCTCGNFLFWLWRTVFLSSRVAYVKKYLKIIDKLHDEEDMKVVSKFADKYLRDDGVFILRIIARNTNDILMTDLVGNLWSIFIEVSEIKQKKQGKDNKGGADSEA